MFDDFDIDYNQYKYLIETRVSGALAKLKSAIVVKKVAASAVLATPLAPAFSGDAVTITNVTGVVYKDGAGTTINAAGSPYAVDPQETFIVNATPDTGTTSPPTTTITGSSSTPARPADLGVTMAKFYGKVGYGESVESPSGSGVWIDQITEGDYYGDVVRNNTRMEAEDAVISDISVSNSISILADEYAIKHFFKIKYVRWEGCPGL